MPSSVERTGAARLPVLWRDEHLVAIFKPAGWLVHRTGLDAGETRFVVQTLRQQLGQPVYPVHRLDKGTCGVLVLALSSAAARSLCEAFAQHLVHKSYLAVVRGWAPEQAWVDHPLRPDDAPADAAPQTAYTRLRCLARLEWPESFDGRFSSTRLSLVHAEPLTGRRHQIRRHLKHLAHPILGDATHGKGPLNRWWAQRCGLHRLWLHAWSLQLPHPVTGAALHFPSGLLLPAHTCTEPLLDTSSALVADIAPWQDWQRLLWRHGWQWMEGAQMEGAGAGVAFAPR